MHTFKLTISGIALLVANVMPLGAVIWYGADIRALFFIYWLETGIMATYIVFKMVWSMTSVPKFLSGVFAIGFFLVHFGTFMAVHLMFISTLLSIGGGQLPDSILETVSQFIQMFIQSNGMLIPYVLVPVLGFYISHGVSFIYNFLIKGEYKTTEPGRLMTGIYARLTTMHIALMVGGFAIVAVSEMVTQDNSFQLAYIVMISVLILYKTVTDLYAHIKEHRITTSSTATS